MKKKWKLIGVAGISGVLMVTSGMAAMAGTSGYDTYKSALKNTKTLKSVSVSAGASLQDNGNTLVNAIGSLKASIEKKTGSGTFTVDSNGTQQIANVFRQDDKSIFKTNLEDVYYVEQNNSMHNKRHADPTKMEMPQEVENVIDSLVGNFQSYISLNSKNDGTKEVSLQLSNTQIPAVVNTVGALLVKKSAEEEGKQGKNEAESPVHIIKPDLPKLSKDIKVEKIDVKANINSSNYIQHQEATIVVSGKDDAGKAHEVILHFNADFSGFDSTTPDTIDLTGKNIKTIAHDQKDGENEQD